jgi:hypothetical protein
MQYLSRKKIYIAGKLKSCHALIFSQASKEENKQEMVV